MWQIKLKQNNSSNKLLCKGLGVWVWKWVKKLPMCREKPKRIFWKSVELLLKTTLRITRKCGWKRNKGDLATFAQHSTGSQSVVYSFAAMLYQRITNSIQQTTVSFHTIRFLTFIAPFCHLWKSNTPVEGYILLRLSFWVCLLRWLTALW